MHTLTIGFRKHSVTIESGTEDLITALARRFRRMIVPGCLDADARIHVFRRDSGFLLDIESKVYSRPELLPQLEYHIMDQLVQSSPSLLWLHAGAVARAGQAVLFSGSSGCGKSTMALGLYARGWNFLSDDILPVHMESNRVYPFLRTPWFRERSETELAPDKICELSKREVEISDDRVESDSAALALIILPIYRHDGELSFEQVSGSPVALDMASHSINFSAHGAAALSFLSRVARQTPAYRIIYSNPKDAINLVEELWYRHKR